VSSLKEIAQKRCDAGENWVAVSDWLDKKLADVEISGKRKRLEIRCTVPVEASPCGNLMGEVFETTMGGVFRLKYRKWEEPLSGAGLARDLAFERRIRRNTPSATDSEDELRSSIKRSYMKEQRYFIWNIWGHQADHPPTRGGTYRQVVCLEHGAYPLDRLGLEAKYAEACRTNSRLEIPCALACLPPRPPGSWGRYWWT
jgi:hypothetical protein